MSQALYLTSLLAALLLGAAASRPLRRVSPRLLRWLTTSVLFLLILTMGFRMGRTRELALQFGRIGLQALLYAGAAVVGTILALYPMFRLFERPGEPGPPDSATPRRALGRLELKVLADPLRLLGILIVGILAGAHLPILQTLRPEAAITGILYALLVLVGITLARSRLRLRDLLDHSLWILPVGTAAGTLLGGGALALSQGQPLGTGLAVASGFGWYSLSGVLLIELDGPVLGATALAANMLREALALVLIPLLARTRYPYLAIGVAGATSMDVTLPLLEAACGPRAVPFSVTSGAVLSAAVPILVPLMYSLG
jgi:uncharacterized membrane protein YbjE (DUF340 family)